jgi:lipopolysaccharide transport system ATP-binding protein
MNGAILGMRKKEIDAKFDDIVDFSGCAMYVDTPIKRFSSGMQVRLGFAVAAFLDPEILIVDEVLAVGDAEFQQKAIGKMQDISSNGERTVLFVSHNMVSIQALCNRAILLGEGGVIAEGKVNDIVDKYMDLNTKDMKKSFSFDNLDECPGNKFVKIKSITIKPEIPSIKEEIKINFEVVNLSENNKLTIAVDFLNNQDMVIFGSATDIEILNNESKKIQCNIPKDFLNDNTYYINVYILDSHKIFLFQLKRAISFDVKDEKRELGYLEKVSGEIRPLLKWNLINE